MSQAWAMNAGKASTAIGTATIASATNLLTIAGHGLGDGDTVTVDTLTGGGSALTENAVYFVRDSTTDDFALSLTLHGPQVEFATDGGADVYSFAPQYSAAELRRVDAVTLHGGVSDAFGARQGVRPGHTPVSVSGTTWTVEHLTAVVYPGLTSTGGPYRVQHESESGSLDPADGSNDRIDALDLQIQDDDADASGFRRARVVYVTGTPASSPSAPAVTTNALRLGTILVPAGGSPSPSVDTLAQWTVASGGVLPVRDDTEGPSAGRYQGMMRYRQDTDTLDVWDGAVWVPLAQPGGWETIFDAEINSATDIPVPSGVYDTIRMHLRGGLTEPGEYIQMQINAEGTADLHQQAYTVWDNASGAVDANDASNGQIWRIAQWGGGDTNTAEATIFHTLANDILIFQGSGYRAAAATLGLRHHTVSNGQLASARLLSSIEIGGSGSADPQDCHVIIEGHRPPS